MIGKSRAFVKIQEGCDFRCNYCIIPFVRGDSRSYDEEKILNQVSVLASNGFGEFILTGTNVGSFGKQPGISNKKDKLSQLIKKISMIRGVRRIRLGSIEPVQITDEFKEILTEPWMGKHLHIALQHTSKEMLNIMNRRNKVINDLELFEFLSSKGYALGTDFIVGHPGETKAFWDDAMQNINKFPLTHIHSFTYSKRDGTPSCTMPNQVDGNIAKQRLKELETKIKNKNRVFRAQKQPLDILIESVKDDIYTGYDQFFNPIEIKSDTDLVGDWVQIEEYEIKESLNSSKF
jgi:MiaB/RimO family radical SAM methylthiotransferase